MHFFILPPKFSDPPILPYAFILNKSQLVMKCSIKHVSHWAMFFGDRISNYHHDNFEVIFYIVQLLSNCP